MITITTSNVNGIRAAKRKGIETWAGEHAPDIWCMQEIRAPQDELDPIFGEFRVRITPPPARSPTRAS